MIAELTPLQVLLVTLAGWINRHQQHVIEYLVEENRVLKEPLTGRRLRPSDDQRRRLAAKGRQLGGRVLRQVAEVWTPRGLITRVHVVGATPTPDAEFMAQAARRPTWLPPAPNWPW